ncbi:MAG: glycosyltransferase family 4 protein [Hespellia sp.]|nr:glycosyltransferase family 4 protein [Hespellia sp.]
MMGKKIYSEKQLVHLIREYQTVIIYGAGMVGELVGNRLLACGLREKIVGFAVSKKGNSTLKEALGGFSIYEIVELKEYKRDALVVVATLPNLHQEIEKTLSEFPFEKTVYMTTRLYKDLCDLYMLDYNRQHPITFLPDRKSRILLMASDNNRTSGAFLCLVELCDQLQKNGIAVAAVLPQYGTGAVLLSQKGVPYTYIPSQDWGYEIAKSWNLFERIRFLVGMLGNCRAEQELVQFIRQNSVDLVHCNTTYTYIGALAAKRCEIPFIWHLRENMEHQGFRIFPWPWARRVMRKADKILAVSEYIRDLMNFGEENITKVVYDAVDMKENTRFSREILQHRPVQMIMVGVIMPYKRQTELIRACAILKERDLFDFRLTIVGNGTKDYIGKLQQMVLEYGLKDEISFYGVSDSVAELYGQSDLAFMCSIAEPYGRVTIEAQISGCLVIGADSGATPELITDGETGYLYQSGNVESLAEKIIEAVNHPEKSRRVARNGQEYAKRTYTKEKSLQQIIETYEEVLEKYR